MLWSQVGCWGIGGRWGCQVGTVQVFFFFTSAKTDTDTSTRSKTLTGMFVPAVSCESQMGQRQTINVRAALIYLILSVVLNFEWWLSCSLLTLTCLRRKASKGGTCLYGEETGWDQIFYNVLRCLDWERHVRLHVELRPVLACGP